MDRSSALTPIGRKWLAADALVPGDSVTASAAVLTCNSIKNAELQAPRVAKERGLILDAAKSKSQGNRWPFAGIRANPASTCKLNIALNNTATR
jgi:K+-transporting ATPase c subunit